MNRATRNVCPQIVMCNNDPNGGHENQWRQCYALLMNHYPGVFVQAWPNYCGSVAELDTELDTLVLKEERVRSGLLWTFFTFADF
jgi:hypothetical protein